MLALLLQGAVSEGAGVPLSEATAEQKSAAQAAFAEGSAKFQAGQLEDARAAFQRSLDVIDSPNARLMLARTLGMLGRGVEAYREARATARQAEAAAVTEPRYAEAAEAARLEMSEIEKTIGLVTVKLRGEGFERLTVAGAEVPPGEWSEPVPVEPGEVVVTGEIATGPLEERVTIGAGQSAEVILEEPPPKAPPVAAPAEPADDGFDPFDGGSDQRVVAIVAASVGGAGLVMFAGFGLAHASTFADLEDQCPDGRCPPSLEGDADTGRTYQTLANVGLVIGAVGLAAGTALFVTSLGGDDDEATAASTAPSLAVSPGFVAVRGAF